MNPERNRQIDRIFQAALAQEPARRQTFLDEACAGDAELRSAVESLLSSDEQANSFIESPAFGIAPELIADGHNKSQSGRVIGPYKLEAQIGAGGMGKVYRAHDLRLGRRVALKLLDPGLTANTEQRTRFLREARLASSLDHPNICAIHEVGEVDGELFIAMQYVEGQTLRDVVKGHPLDLDTLLSISLQVSDALAGAHDAGIIHRDIKPGNIMISPKGQAKVLDFGLAKLLERSEGEADTHLTMTGAVMGTPASMSPEQAKGQHVDHRSDIFSFGGVMYEMATGQIPFKGRTRAEVMGAVLHQPHAPAVELNKKIPAQLSAIIDRALAKDPAERFQTMSDVIAALRQVIIEAGMLDQLFHSSGARRGFMTPYIPPRPRTFPKRAAIVAFSVVSLSLLVLAVYFWSGFSTTPLQPQQSLISTFPGSHRGASFSPDGQKIAFESAVDGVPQVWVKDLTQGQPTQITFGEDRAQRPRWSPSGDQIIFARRSKGDFGVWSVSPGGGEPRKVIEGGRNPNWSANGARIVFERGYDIWTANSDGSDQRKIEGVPPTDLLLTDRMPAFSPDGLKIVFFQKSRGPMGDYWVVPSTGGQARQLTHDDALGGAPVWTPDGSFIVFPSRRSGSLTLWKVAAAGGEPQPVLVSPGEDTDPEFSRDGRRLIYTNTRNSYVVTVSDPTTGQHQELHQSRSPLVEPSFAPRGDRIAFFGFAETGGVHLYTMNPDGSNVKLLTQGKDQQNIHPQWAADASALYFYRQRPSIAFCKLSLSDGSTTELVKGWEWATHHDARVDPQGRRVIYTRLDRGTPAATMIRDLSSGDEMAFSVLLRQAIWSHDAKFIAGVKMTGQQRSTAEVVICDAEGNYCRTLTSGYSPHWSADDSRIYFYRPSKLRDGEELWSITSDGASPEKHVLNLQPMESIGLFFDVSPAGKIVWVQYRPGKNELWLSDYSPRP